MCPHSLRTTGSQDELAAPNSAAPRYAGVWIRFAALAIDGLLFCSVFFPVTRLIKGVWLMSPGDHRWTSGWFIFDPLRLVFLIVMFVYFAVLEGCLRATFGKWVPKDVHNVHDVHTLAMPRLQGRQTEV